MQPINPFQRSDPTSAEIAAFIAKLNATNQFEAFSKTKLTSQNAAGKVVSTAAAFTDVKRSDDSKLVLTAAQTKNIETAIAQTNATKDSIKSYQETMAAINQLIKDANNKDNQFKPQDFKDELLRQQGMLTTAITQQHDAELKNLKALFNNTTFTDDLQKSNPKEDLAKLQTKMEEALKSSQKQQLADLKKAFDSENKAMLQAEQKQRELDFFFAFVAGKNKKNFESFRKIAAGKEGADDTVSMANSKSPELLRGLAMVDITTFETASGKTVTHTNGVFSLRSKFYGFAISQSDVNAVALAVKASLLEKGKSVDELSISMKVNHDDPKVAAELAEKAYKACRLAGFPSDRISIVVNGTKDENINKQHANDDIKPLIDSQTQAKADTKAFRDAVSKVRDEIKNSQAQAPVATTSLSAG